MPISYNSQERVFRLDTPHTTYLMGLATEESFLGHIYYGPTVPDDNMRYLLRTGEKPFTPETAPADRCSFFDAFPWEYPTRAGGDFRTPCLSVRTPDGGAGCELTYAGHRITPGKPALPGLPAAYGGPEDCETLEIICRDAALGLTVRLFYTAFTRIDAICRSARIENGGDADLTLTAALSACLDMDNEGFDMLALRGTWAGEHIIERQSLGPGRHAAFSQRGISSHQWNPFLALAERTAAQERGLVYGMSFVYSGNFLAQAEVDQFDSVRAVMGIHPEGFGWVLEPGESFQTPEAVLVCSENGLGGMSRTFHDLFRRHLIRGQDKHRPTLVNSWEAAYFDFDTDSLLKLGRAAAEEGIELLVVDDGWFGRRDREDSSLGDWYVYEKKLPGGLKRLGEELGKMGVGLGLWMEPEMISPDSDLYRAHPDYAMAVPGRTPTLARNQYVLDLTRREVRDCVWEQIAAVLRSAPISYVKWDMNRPLVDVYSPSLPPRRQGEAAHRYVLGLYEMQERLVTEFPDILLENCCSGGGRFDAGMLYYSPQIWTSDNTEAVDRLAIQEGTSLVYPLSSMGAHVAACPSHTNGRVTPFETRGNVSLPGCFGYELDLNKLEGADRGLIRGQLAAYRELGPVFRDGDCYRLASYRENHTHDAVMAVSKDKSLAAVDCILVHSRAPRRSLRLKLAGLDPRRRYRDRESGEVRTGAGWMRGGILLPARQGDFLSTLVVLEAAEP